jgi:hypothetical protein
MKKKLLYFLTCRLWPAEVYMLSIILSTPVGSNRPYGTRPSSSGLTYGASPIPATNFNIYFIRLNKEICIYIPQM